MVEGDSPGLGLRSRILDIDARIDWPIIGAIGLLLAGFWALQLSQPTYMDAFYYTTNGQRLAAGHGFTETVIWQFLDDPAGLPTPSHTYWMPMPSILAALGLKLRDGFGGAQFVFWLLAGLLPLLAYAISRQLTGQRWQAWVAALFTAAGGFYAGFLNQPSTFAPFAWAGGLCLLALGLATAGKTIDEPVPATEGRAPTGRQYKWWLLAGIMAGMAHLTRADGLLLLLVGLAVWLTAFRSWRQAGLAKGADLNQVPDSWVPFSYLLILIAGYLLGMGGWFIRNWLVIGRPLSSAGAQSMFLTTYDDLFAYGRSFNISTYLEWGWRSILRSKLDALWIGLQTFMAIPGLIFLVPFIIVGAVDLWRKPAGKALIRPVLLYAGGLFVFGTLIFSFPGIRGSLFHSSIALWPWSMALAAAGIGVAVDWAAKRRSHWQPERAKRTFSAMFIVVALVLSMVVSLRRSAPIEDPAIYRRIGEMLPPASVVMAGNAPALNYYTGLAAVSVPNEPAEVVLDAAERYGVTHMILDQNRPLPLSDLYAGRSTHPRVELLQTFDDVKLYRLKERDR